MNGYIGGGVDGVPAPSGIISLIFGLAFNLLISWYYWMVTKKYAADMSK